MGESGEREREQRGRGPTIRDVARHAGVSIGTASKALNANGRLRQETRDKVIRVARELGYRPNDLAQSLHRNKSMTVGIISNDSFGRFTLPIVEALEDQLAERGIAISGVSISPVGGRIRSVTAMRLRRLTSGWLCHGTSKCSEKL